MVKGLLAVVFAVSITPLTAHPSQASLQLCFGMVPTIVGTAGNDVLIGNAGTSDVIFGGGGDDYIAAEDFSEMPLGQPGDFLCGGSGDDVIRGSTGPEMIRGGGGNDDVDGRGGADSTYGNKGDDRVGDCEGEDAFNEDVDHLFGGYGNDALCTQGSGADVLRGQNGDDTLVDLTCAGSKQLFGGIGTDSLESSIDSFEGTTCAEAGDDDPDELFGGYGEDTASATARDLLHSVELVVLNRVG